jgi:Tfp pilus assembly protein PilF
MIRRKGRLLSAALLSGLFWIACASSPPQRKATDRQAEQYFRLAQANFAEGKNQEAIQNLKKSLQLNPKDADVHAYLGVVYLLLSDFQQAEKEMEEALKLNPYLTDARNSLGAVQMKTGRPEEARATFEEALKDKTYPSPEKILYNLGTIHLEAKRYPEALDAFRRAVASNANYAKGYYGLGLVYAETGKAEDARASFRKAIALEPKSPEADRAREYLAQKAAPAKE